MTLSSDAPARRADDFSSLAWGKVDLSLCPRIVVPPPGPQSAAWHRRCTAHFKGLSSQVTLFPVAFESGEGCVLVDVDGNRQTAMTYMVRSVPTLLLFKGGAVVQQSVGLINAKKLKDMLEKVL